jgi:NADH-quinone oxidoreductase subunit G
VLRPGSTVVLWGERLGWRDPAALDALSACARALRLDADGAGLIEVPEATNARGLREAGMVPVAAPGLAETESGGGAAAIREALAAGELEAAIVANANPVREYPGGPAWDEALAKAKFVVAISAFDDASAQHANVVFPAESHAEKEGTVTHPDGRLQRLRPSIPHPDNVRPGWQVLSELAARLGDETDIDSAPEALTALTAEVPFYAGLTPEEIGGRGIRWQECEASSAYPRTPEAVSRTQASSAASANGGLALGTYRDLWAAEVTDRSPALRFLAPRQTLEIAPADAERIGVAQGDEVEVRSNGTSVRARVAIRERMRPGAAFMLEATVEANANALSAAESIEVVRVGARAEAPEPEAEGVAG